MSLFFTGVSVVLIQFAIFLVWLAVRRFRQARRAATWPTHPATVIQSRSRIIGLYRTFPTRGISMRLELTYWWTIDGRRYEGSRERFTIWRLGSKTPPEVAAALAEAQPGATITIRVDPEDHAEAVVDPTVDQAAVLTAILLGLLFGAYGCWMLLNETSVVG